MIFQDTVAVYLRCFTKLFTCLYWIHNETKTLLMKETKSAGSFHLYSFIFGLQIGKQICRDLISSSWLQSVCMWCLPSDSTIFMVSTGDYLLSWVTHIRPCCQAWLRGPLTNPISLRTTGAWMLQSRASHTPGIPASPNMPGWPTGPGKPRGPRGPSIPSFGSTGWPGSPV